MLTKRNQYDEDFKMNAVKLSYASPKTIKEIASDLGIAESLLYSWRKKYMSTPILKCRKMAIKFCS